MTGYIGMNKSILHNWITVVHNWKKKMCGQRYETISIWKIHGVNITVHLSQGLNYVHTKNINQRIRTSIISLFALLICFKCEKEKVNEFKMRLFMHKRFRLGYINRLVPLK